LIEEDYGPRVALSVARELVVFLKRSGGQKQYSEPLEFQINSADRFSDLASWMVEHVRSDLSLDALAKRVCLSPRHCARRFKQVFGGTPRAFVENLRLDEARPPSNPADPNDRERRDFRRIQERRRIPARVPPPVRGQAKYLPGPIRCARYLTTPTAQLKMLSLSIIVPVLLRNALFGHRRSTVPRGGSEMALRNRPSL
jgi:hypothetical protein